VNKRLMAIELTPRLKLTYQQIVAKVELEMVHAVIIHYQSAIPKLYDDFVALFDEAKSIPPADRRLLTLKLIHYKNALIEERLGSQTNKLNRDDNRLDDYPQDYEEESNQQQRTAFRPQRARNTETYRSPSPVRPYRGPPRGNQPRQQQHNLQQQPP
jgi:hypothetical protein